MIFTIALVFLFILKIKYVRNSEIFINIKHKYGAHILKKVRLLEKLSFKCIKVNLDLKFLCECQDSHLTPKFLYFKLSIQRLNNSKLYNQFQRRILHNEIQHKIKEKKKLLSELSHQKKNVKNNISMFDYIHLDAVISKSGNLYKQKIENIHLKKLTTLGYTGTAKYNDDPNNVVFNFSNYSLSEEEKSLLALGLNFCITNTKYDSLNHFLKFEKLAYMLSKCEFYNKSNNRVNEFMSSLKYITFSSLKRIIKSKLQNNITSKNLATLKSLSSNKNIVFLKPDKGNGVVILNKSEYVNKMNSILCDNSKFKPINKDLFKLIISLEDKITRFLRYLKNVNVIDLDVFNSLTPSGSNVGILYGLPKVHKANNPLRPILSTIGTHNYKLAKFLIPLINKWSTNEYSVNNTFEFVNFINNHPTNDKYVMASFDITSLYTNVPVKETINIILNLAFDNNTNNKYCNFSKDQFSKLLNLTLLDSYFLFNEKLYLQVDGLAMGSCIAPTLANLFLCYHEKKWLDECPILFKPVIYKRYVDDTFLVFKDKDHINLFLNYLNEKHNNIKFTCEHEVDKQLSFLDINIIHENNKFNTNVFRKTTHTGLGMNFKSFLPINFKINSIKCLLFRAYNICSSYLSFHNETSFLKSYFIKNGYPINIIDNQIKNFLNKQYSNIPKLSSASRDIIYFKFPYCGYESFQIRNKIKKLLSEFYPQVEIRFIFTNNFKIGNFFNIKDRMPANLRSSIIYKYCCNCNVTYIGKTERHLFVRASEHAGVSYRTGKQLTTPPHSAIQDHCRITGHTFDSDNFNILKINKNPFELSLLESILIKKLKPSLNNTLSSMELKIY